jgi:hypothetical protein
MKRIVICFVLVFIFIFISAPLFAKTEATRDKGIKCLHLKTPVLPKTGHCIDDFVPKGWKLIDKVVGDLNKDGLPDIAGVIEEILDDYEYFNGCDQNRILFVAFNKGVSRYKLSVQKNNIILTLYDGGLWGDPFVATRFDQYQHGDNQRTGIFVNRGSLLIRFYGGSSWRWSRKFRFRYQNEGWYLIGYDYEYYHTSGWQGQNNSVSYNYLTGKKIEGFNESKEPDDSYPYYNGSNYIDSEDQPRDIEDPEWVWKKKTSYKRTKKLISLKNFNQHSVDNIAVWERDGWDYLWQRD